MLPSTNVYSRDLESLLNSLPEIKPIETDLVAAAYQRAEAAHSGQKRKSGEPCGSPEFPLRHGRQPAS